MRILYFFLLIAALLPSVYGHVRLYRTDKDGVVNDAPIRNAPSATSDGAFSVSGPCGGVQQWGKNGVKQVSAGDTIKITIGYNGGHQSKDNVFRVAFACGKPDSDAVLKNAANTLNEVPKQEEPTSAVANKHTFTVTLPSPPPGVTNGDKCTLSALDQRNWGGCIDLQFPTSGGDPTTKPPSTPTTKAPTGSTAKPSTTIKPATTTVPPPKTSGKLNGDYFIGLGCDSTAPGCCCIQGVLSASVSTNAQSITFKGDKLRSNCPNAPTLSQTFTATLQADGSYKNNEFLLRGEPFTAEVIAEKRQVILTNVNDNKPATCSFTATKPPSTDDDDNAPCSHPTSDQVKACLSSINSLPACEADQPASFDYKKCCQTCRPSVITTRPKCPFDDIPRCASGTSPLISNVTGCPSCVQLDRSCKTNAATIPLCPVGVLPQRDSNDCISCKPQPDLKCTPQARAECAKKNANNALPPCEAGLDQTYQADFDINNCCRTCQPPSDQDRPANGKTCTKDEVKACLNKIPICEDGEKPEKNATRCCPTCKRATRDCKIADVAVCRSNARLCAAGEVPGHVAGECCATCRPAPPSCTPACNSTSICIRDIAPGSKLADRLSAPGRCFPRRNIVASIDITSLNGKSDAASIKGLIEEIVSRFCELPRMKDVCGATEIARMDIDVQLIDINGNIARVRIGFATQARAVASSLMLRLQATSADIACWSDDACTTNTDSTVLFNEALADPLSTEGVSISVEGTTSAAFSINSSFLTMLASFIALFIARRF